MSNLQICKPLLKKSNHEKCYVSNIITIISEKNNANISKTYTPCAHITNSSSSPLATQLGESLIQLAHMESCSAASRRIKPSPNRYGENEVETWTPPDCGTQDIILWRCITLCIIVCVVQFTGIYVIHKWSSRNQSSQRLVPDRDVRVWGSTVCMCAVILHFKSIQWFTVATWIPIGTIPCTFTSNSHVHGSRKLMIQASCKNYWWGTIQRAKPNGSECRIQEVLTSWKWNGWMQPRGYCQNSVRWPWFHMVSLVFHRLNRLHM